MRLIEKLLSWVQTTILSIESCEWLKSKTEWINEHFQFFPNLFQVELSKECEMREMVK